MQLEVFHIELAKFDTKYLIFLRNQEMGENLYTNSHNKMVWGGSYIVGELCCICAEIHVNMKTASQIFQSWKATRVFAVVKVVHKLPHLQPKTFSTSREPLCNIQKVLAISPQRMFPAKCKILDDWLSFEDFTFVKFACEFALNTHEGILGLILRHLIPYPFFWLTASHSIFSNLLIKAIHKVYFIQFKEISYCISV